jgi:hypothetical protein
MKRRLIQASAGLALMASLVFAATATAAPVLGVEMTRSPEAIARNDQFASYEVKVKNTSPTDPTAGALTVSVAMPAGLTLAAASGTGWSCMLGTRTCVNSTVVAAGGFYPTLKLSQVWLGEGAPAIVTVTATASGGGASSGASAENSFAFGPATPFGLGVTAAKAEDEAGNDETRAGAHPYAASATFTTRIRTRPDGIRVPIEDLHSGVSEIPAGVVGNPSVVEAVCSVNRMKEDKCPQASEVGGVWLKLTHPQEKTPNLIDQHARVFRLPHEAGYPATFGFKTGAPAFVVRTKVRADGDYGITAVIPLVPSEPALYESVFTFCAFGPKGFVGEKLICKKRAEVGASAKPFLTNGTNCAGDPPLTKFAVDSWNHRGSYGSNGLPDLGDPNWASLSVTSPPLTGCERLTEEWVGQHEPSFGFQPDNHTADSPAAYTAHLHIPQDGLLDPEGLATSHLKDVKVVLPRGIGFNPGIGDGLAACSEEQIGLLGTGFPSPSRIRFDTQYPHCPPSSKVGLATIRTPLLDETLYGSVYLASQKDNPYGSDYAIYLTVEEPDVGIIAKFAGKVVPDSETGQITTTFQDNPQLPFEDLTLAFFGGGRAALANPVSCGSFDVATEMTPWSAVDPERPAATEVARPTDQIQIGSGPGGSPCVSSPAKRPFNVGLSAGARDPIAGMHSPFSIRITRPDGSQELDRLEISPPPGFVASLRGIPYCSDAQIAAATAASGKAEQASPSCPSASEVGTTNSGTGPGPTPFYAPGKLYLAGPYKGETLSVVAVTPAVAGPFDLGNVVVRSALRIDPKTARITAVTDPLPRILRGIPLRIRDVRIDLDRPGWALNPTSCEAMAVDLTAFGSDGAVAKPSSRFQVGACDALAFKPKLSIHLKGGTRRGDHPALVAKLSTRHGDANIARAAVTLPHSAFLDQAHIRTICTRVQFAADACPKGAVYGYASATTPLLDDPIQGDVLLRSSTNKLPDLVADLRGVANIEAVGRVDSVHGGIRTTFDVIPDAPFDVFTLAMRGGDKGLVVNSRSLCAAASRATVKLDAQNGRRYVFRPRVVADGCAKRGNRGGRPSLGRTLDG